jgi:hypothetical protein
MAQTLNIQDWGNLSYDYSLTIEDILNLKAGEQIKVLSMDRNVWDIALKDEIRGKACTPKEFFKHNWAIYIHEKDLHGKCVFEFEHSNNDTEQIDVNTFDLNAICQPNFEFHIEYKHHCWYPLENGYLPAFDSQGLSHFPWEVKPPAGTEPQKQHWSMFPKTTRVGWRGCFIPWSKLDEMPNIIWEFPKEVLNAFDDENNRTIYRTFNMVTDNELINLLFKRNNIRPDENVFTNNKIELNTITPVESVPDKSIFSLDYWKDIFNFDKPTDDDTDSDSDSDSNSDSGDKLLCPVIKHETSKRAVGRFSYMVKEKFKKNNVKFPVTFDIDVVETTENSNYQTYKYNVTLEKDDDDYVDGMRRLGRIITTKIK